MSRILVLQHRLFFVTKMLFGVLDQIVEDFCEVLRVSAAAVTVMELVDQLEKAAMLLVDVFDADAVVLPPA